MQSPGGARRPERGDPGPAANPGQRPHRTGAEPRSGVAENRYFHPCRGAEPRGQGKITCFRDLVLGLGGKNNSGDGKQVRLRFAPTQEKLRLYERQASEVPRSSGNAVASVSSLAAAASPSQGSGTSRAAARQRRRHLAANERVPRCAFRRGDGLSAGGRTPFVLSPSKDT